MMLREDSFSKKWPVVSLSDVVEFLDSRRKPVKASERVEGDYAYYGANGLQGSIDNYIFDEPLVLLAEDGGHFGNPERDIAYIATGKYWVNNHAHVLKPKEGVNLSFLFRVLQRYDVSPFIKGATRAKLTKGDASRIPFPLPPLAEQKRIAAILDKADAIRQKRQQAIKLADEFLRSVFLEMFGDPVTNPKGWKKRKLKSLLSSIDSGKSPKCDGQPANADEWGVLKLSAVTSGQYLAQENKAVLSKNDVDERFEVVAGDVLFTRKNTRELVAAVAYVFETEPRKLMPDLIFRLNIKDKCELEPLYLFSLLANKSQRSDIQQLAGGAAGSMPNISKAKLLEVEVPVPPIELQCRFAEVVIKIRKSHQRNTESQSNSFLFFNSLSQKAFSGQL